MKKKCSKCGENYPVTDEYFYKDSKKKDGWHSVCKKCRIMYGIEHRQKNKEKIKEYQRQHKEELKQYNKEYGLAYRQKNKEKIKKKNKKYHKAHQAESKKYNKKYQKKYYQKNSEQIKKRCAVYIRKRRRSDSDFKILDNLRRRLNHAFHNQNTKKSKRTMELLGCDIDFLKNHLEVLFLDGMTWDNYGLHGWHIDHIKPCVTFDLTMEEEQKKCFNYKNLQPLWAKDNWSKSSNYKGKLIRK